MKRNFLLIGGIIFALILGINSARKIMTFRGTFEKVEEAQQTLEKLQEENETLKRDLAYKQSEEFAEKEIRNKLGMVKEGEAIVIVPKTNDERLTTNDERNDLPNWQKWKELFFGKS